MSYIGNTLRTLRIDEGISLVTLARETKINILTLTSYELSLSDPTSEDLTTLADYFNSTIDFIIGLESNPNVDKLEGNTLPQKLRDAGC